MVDRRKDVRAVVRLEVEDQGSRLKRVPLYISFNISVGGMFLLTKDPLPEGTEINLKFSLPHQDTPMQVTGRVLWVREPHKTQDPNPGMGIQFINISKSETSTIWEFIEEATGSV